MLQISFTIHIFSYNTHFTMVIKKLVQCYWKELTLGEFYVTMIGGVDMEESKPMLQWVLLLQSNLVMPKFKESQEVGFNDGPLFHQRFGFFDIFLFQKSHWRQHKTVSAFFTFNLLDAGCLANVCYIDNRLVLEI